MLFRSASNNRGYVCNTTWIAHVYQTKPIYRFSGSGTLVAMGENTTNSVLNAITTDFKTDLQTQLNAALSKDTTGLTDQQIAQNALNALTGTIDGYMALLNKTVGSPDIFKNGTSGAEQIKISVYGMRKYF